jgi:hypothetical protein
LIPRYPSGLDCASRRHAKPAHRSVQAVPHNMAAPRQSRHERDGHWGQGGTGSQACVRAVPPRLPAAFCLHASQPASQPASLLCVAPAPPLGRILPGRALPGRAEPGLSGRRGRGEVAPPHLSTSPQPGRTEPKGGGGGGGGGRRGTRTSGSRTSTAGRRAAAAPRRAAARRPSTRAAARRCPWPPKPSPPARASSPTSPASPTSSRASARPAAAAAAGRRTTARPRPGPGRGPPDHGDPTAAGPERRRRPAGAGRVGCAGRTTGRGCRTRWAGIIMSIRLDV